MLTLIVLLRAIHPVAQKYKAIILVFLCGATQRIACSEVYRKASAATLIAFESPLSSSIVALLAFHAGGALADALPGADQRKPVNQLVGNRRHRFLALAAQKQILNLMRVIGPSLTADMIGVEVLAAGPSHQHKSDAWLVRFARRFQVIVYDNVDRHRDLEIAKSLARTSSPKGVETAAEVAKSERARKAAPR